MLTRVMMEPVTNAHQTAKLVPGALLSSPPNAVPVMMHMLQGVVMESVMPVQTIVLNVRIQELPQSAHTTIVSLVLRTNWQIRLASNVLTIATLATWMWIL